MLRGRWLVWKIPLHGIEWNEDLTDIDSVVTRVLILRLHDTDHGIRDSIKLNRLSQGFAVPKQLLLRIAAQERHTPALLIVFVVIKAPLSYRNAANLSEGWKGAHGIEIAAIERAVHFHVIAQFRHHILASRRFLCHFFIVIFHPVHSAARPRAARLHAGSPGEHDHHILAEIFLLFLNAAAQSLSRGYHQCDGDDSPRNPEHSQQRPPLVRPERRNRIPQEITKRHKGSRY